MSKPRERWKVKFDSFAGHEWISVRDYNQPEEPPITMSVAEARLLRNRLNAELGRYRQEQIEKGRHNG